MASKKIAKVRDGVDMRLSVRLLGISGFIIVWTSQGSVLATTLRPFVPLGAACGECLGLCNQQTELCDKGCKVGWRGRGCKHRCLDEEDCENPCRCYKACHCDVQLGTCTAIRCMAANTDTDNGEEDSNDNRLLAFALLFVCGAAIFFGALAFCVQLWRSESNGLRGRWLSHPWCAKCPCFRDFLQRVGNRLGLKSLRIGARDSLDIFLEEGERQTAFYSQSIRQTRRGKDAPIVGVRTDKPQPKTATGLSGYRWKKKWRERRERSKQKRKAKHELRKQQRKLTAESQQKGSSTSTDPAEAGADGAGATGAGVEKRGSIILPSISIGATLTSTARSMGRRGSAMASNLINHLRRGSVRPESPQGSKGQQSSGGETGSQLEVPVDPGRDASAQEVSAATDGSSASLTGLRSETVCAVIVAVHAPASDPAVTAESPMSSPSSSLGRMEEKVGSDPNSDQRKSSGSQSLFEGPIMKISDAIHGRSADELAASTSVSPETLSLSSSP